jgi:hypothetical protein
LSFINTEGPHRIEPTERGPLLNNQTETLFDASKSLQGPGKDVNRQANPFPGLSAVGEARGSKKRKIERLPEKQQYRSKTSALESEILDGQARNTLHPAPTHVSTTRAKGDKHSQTQHQQRSVQS